MEQQHNDDILDRLTVGDLVNMGLADECPKWIDPQTTVSSAWHAMKYGCDSGAYMPATEYDTASQLLGEYGEEIRTVAYDSGWIAESARALLDESWGLFATKLVSTAVEQWFAYVLYEVFERVDEATGKDFYAGDQNYGLMAAAVGELVKITNCEVK